MSSRFSTDMAGTLLEIETAIRTAIQKFEPRLINVRARLLDKPDYDINMTLDVDAVIETSEEKVPVALKVVITSSGRVDVTA